MVSTTKQCKYTTHFLLALEKGEIRERYQKKERWRESPPPNCMQESLCLCVYWACWHTFPNLYVFTICSCAYTQNTHTWFCKYGNVAATVEPNFELYIHVWSAPSNFLKEKKLTWKRRTTSRPTSKWVFFCFQRAIPSSLANLFLFPT